jgi:hypothetical protein
MTENRRRKTEDGRQKSGVIPARHKGVIPVRHKGVIPVRHKGVIPAKAGIQSQRNTYKIILLACLIAGICAITYIQFLTPTLYGADGYLHIRMAEFIKTSGFLHEFHWTRYSIWAQDFSDKDLLYHILLIPFTYFSNIFFGAKIAAVFFAGMLFLSFYFLLKKYVKPGLIPFLLMCFFLSPHYLSALSRPRSMIFAMALGLLTAHFLIQGKFWRVFGVVLIYGLSHVSAPLMIVFALICESMRWFHEKKFYKKTILAVLLGLGISILIHPNFPQNLKQFYLILVKIPFYATKTGVLEMGAEFFPLNTRDFLFNYPIFIIGIGLVLFLEMIRKKENTPFATKVFFIYAAGFMGYAFISQRYAIHGYPFFLIWLGCVIPALRLRSGQAPAGIHIYILTVIFLFILGICVFNNMRDKAKMIAISNSHYERIGNWMKDNIPAGELVFHANWSDSQYFIGLNPRNDYFVTLDPAFMYEWDSKMYQLYRDVSFGRTSDPYVVLKNMFKAKYGYAGKSYFQGLISQVRRDKRFKILAEDKFGVIFHVTEK